MVITYKTRSGAKYLKNRTVCRPIRSHPIYYYHGGGYVQNMDEYHKMKVLTLLHSLCLKTATAEAEEYGWR